MSVITVTKDNFDDVVIKSEKPVLLDFWAPWCGPCRMMSKVIDEIAEDAVDFVVGKVNVDEEQELAQQFGVMSIPTLFVLKNGEITARSLGAKPKAQVLEMLK